MRVLLVLVVALCYAGDTSEAWEAIAHAQLGAESGLDGSFENLPDMWPSYYDLSHIGEVRSPSDVYNITEWFAWSHAMVRTGRTTAVPNVPRHARDDRDPGRVMYDLYRRDGGSSAEAYQTALGFLTHNAQDRAVHYRFFRGGSRAAWQEEHQYKELWADCWVYQIRVNKGVPDGGFTRDGAPSRPLQMRIRGDAELIARAQKVFVDASLSVDHVGRVSIPHVETAAEVRERIDGLQVQVDKYLRTFHRRFCDWHRKWIVNYDWDVDELQDYYERALDATKDIVGRSPR